MLRNILLHIWQYLWKWTKKLNHKIAKVPLKFLIPLSIIASIVYGYFWHHLVSLAAGITAAVLLILKIYGVKYSSCLFDNINLSKLLNILK